MKKPSASFVIPCYNSAAYLRDCIESCMIQTKTNIEVVVVNDGSTDRSHKIIDWYAARDSRLTSIKLDMNYGRSIARNHGIERAQADIILCLDADDMAQQNRVKETLKYFYKNPNIDILYGSFQVIDQVNAVQGICQATPFNWSKILKTGFTYIGHSTMAFKKKVFNMVQYSDGPYCKNGIDDWKFQIDAYKCGFKFGHISNVLSYYRFIPKQRDEESIAKLKQDCLELIKQEEQVFVELSNHKGNVHV